MGMKLPRASKLRLKSPRPSKFRNQKTQVDGITFDSKKEARRWTVLRAEQATGLIGGLRRQVRFKIKLNGVKIATYVSDFVYVRNGQRVVEDVKGMKTRIYMMKRRLMLAIYNIEILES